MADDQAFVVMQIGAKDSPERKRADEVFEFIVRPALAQFKIKAYRADLDPSPGGITAKMLTELLESKLVIADLSGRNPNVFYELGIAHSFARPLISIVDSISALPFDTKDQRVIELGTHAETGLGYAQGETAKKSLIASLEVVLAEGYSPPSPVRDVAGSQSLDALAPENPFASELSGMRETIDEIRSLVQPRTRAVVPRSIRADRAVMREAIEFLLSSGRITPSDLPVMVTQETSSEHDDWVRDLADIEVESRRAVSSDPWATPGSSTPDWGQSVTANEDPWASPGPPREAPPF